MLRIRLEILCLSLLLGLLAAVPASATKYVKWNAPGPTFDGSNWVKAYKTIQEALNVAVDGEIVKVAQGTYNENIIYKSGATLQGGWRGNTTPATPPDIVRDPATYVTTIDGGAVASGNSTVTTYANGGIDGFVLEGAERQIYCTTSFTINRNIFLSDVYGILCYGSSPAITSNVFTGKTAAQTAIHLEAYQNGTTCAATVTGNTISGYTTGITTYSSYIGYPHYYWPNSSPTISQNTVSDCQKGIYIQGEAAGPIITQNSFANCVFGADSRRSRAKIQNNKLIAGIRGEIGVQCGAYGCEADAIRIEANSIRGFSKYGISCYAYYSGYPCYATGSCVPTIKDNYITGSGINGIQCRRATPNIAGNTIIGNTECGVYCYNDVDSASMISLTIDGNVIQQQKKGIHSYGCSVTIKNNYIQFCSQSGVLCQSTSVASNSDVIDNMIYGGVIGINSQGTQAVPSTPKILRNIIVGQKESCIKSQNANSQQIYSNLLDSAGQYGIDCIGGSTNIRNNTIVKNGWYGIYVESGTHSAHNNLVSGSPIGIFAEAGTPTLGNNNFWANEMDYYNIDTPATDIHVDPMFLASAVGEYHLLPGSPCIGVGDNTKVTAGDKDADGKDRILPTGGVVDIGCFEWDETPYWVRNANQAKVIPAQYQIQMKNKAVTAMWADSLYMEDYDRKSGIRVEKVAHGLAATDLRATAVGSVQTNADGERSLVASSVAAAVGNSTIDPLLVNGRSIGGGGLFDSTSGLGQQGIDGSAGLNNIGLLVKVYGRVVAVDGSASPAWFKIDDGSGRQIKCVAEAGIPAINPLWQDKYAFVTGISSCEFDGAVLVSKIRVKSVETN